MNYLIGLLCLCLVALEVKAVPAPAQADGSKYFSANDLPKCATDEDQLADCIKEILNTLMPRLKDGNPKLRIPPYEPLHLNRTSFQYSSGTVNGRITARNAKIYGIAANTAKEVKIELNGDKVKLNLITFMPKMNIVGSYKADLQVNQLHLKPKGEFNVTLKDVEVAIQTEGELYKKDGHRFLRLSNIDTSPKIGDLKIKANGIFADPELDELALNFANQYWRDIYGIMLPETRQFWQPLMLRMFNEALELVPIDQFINDESFN
ncbi:uncharacterized protein LOC117587993 [Drosophila guanche]|uniref:Circadian clock-controlled protein n=1 Tax=Drosophila guanche TaxID=7266 RepID=A0A3B0JXE8_DROGU|nr:uncharacterized protein LOC117587993 [Drosophila guanche]SPP85743.1 Hypothetical predicted protein [Drosophila guanche]